ncbi:ArsR/SmtB family transcription factor [Streptomyces aureoverticillatus]|uniref:ArsR/SmtB family transcription factor n=1 Tax=Streptomyces aureoverticillatus TaxID=66871 RepID=UPI0013DBC451|nr:winged helix-turn-helix domain-containing protein [Streptomyces aureoverticillatus]QIB42293.1 winged helix-turn-helix transcriptional regulator [Streptomyces aureoverticillatus]
MADEERPQNGTGEDVAGTGEERILLGESRLRRLDPEREPAAIKALTHPLRIRLLGLLRMDGPATASELAASTGESSASTSYHLRVLAKYAFVAEAEHRDGRERRWRAVHAVTTWDHSAMDASPVGRDFAGIMARRQIENFGATLARHESDIADGRLGREWLDHAGITDLMPRLTSESLGELKQAYEDKLEELAARDAGDARAEQVMVFYGMLPVAGRADASAAADSSPRADSPPSAHAAAEAEPAKAHDPVNANAAPRRLTGYTHD